MTSHDALLLLHHHDKSCWLSGATTFLFFGLSITTYCIYLSLPCYKCPCVLKIKESVKRVNIYLILPWLPLLHHSWAQFLYFQCFLQWIHLAIITTKKHALMLNQWLLMLSRLQRRKTKQFQQHYSGCISMTVLSGYQYSILQAFNYVPIYYNLFILFLDYMFSLIVFFFFFNRAVMLLCC